MYLFPVGTIFRRPQDYHTRRSKLSKKRTGRVASATLAHLPDTGVNAVKVDAAGNIYIAGFHGTVGAPDSYDAFVAKLSPDDSKVLYSTNFAGRKSDFVSALEIDSPGRRLCFRSNAISGLSRDARRAACHAAGTNCHPHASTALGAAAYPYGVEPEQVSIKRALGGRYPSFERPAPAI